MIGSRLRLLFSPVRYAVPVAAVVRVLATRRQLFWEMTRRELRDRYAGQALGSLWAVLTPALTMAVYLFVFSYVFKARMPTGGADSTGGWGDSYSLYLLSGLIPWLALQEVMTRSTGCITGNANLVKQIVFPEEMLPLKIIGPALLTQIVALALVAVYACLRHGPPPATFLLLPFLLLFQTLAMAGFALIFAALAPFFRDLKDLIGLFCFVLIYAMPVFYTPGMLPGRIESLLRLNPFTHMVECWHDAAYWGTFASPVSWFVFPAFALAAFAVGCRLFSVLRAMFGNVL